MPNLVESALFWAGAIRAAGVHADVIFRPDFVTLRACIRIGAIELWPPPAPLRPLKAGERKPSQ